MYSPVHTFLLLRFFPGIFLVRLITLYIRARGDDPQFLQ